MPWMVCTVWPAKVRGEEVYIVVNVYRFEYMFMCVLTVPELVGLGWKSSLRGAGRVGNEVSYRG